MRQDRTFHRILPLISKKQQLFLHCPDKSRNDGTFEQECVTIEPNMFSGEKYSVGSGSPRKIWH